MLLCIVSVHLSHRGGRGLGCGRRPSPARSKEGAALYADGKFQCVGGTSLLGPTSTANCLVNLTFQVSRATLIELQLYINTWVWDWSEKPDMVIAITFGLGKY